jgi:hypothetical protein
MRRCAKFSALIWLAAAAALAAEMKGLRVYTCGHSFHVWSARIIEDMAKSAGIQDHQIAGLSSIGGSRVIQALTAGKVDVLSFRRSGCRMRASGNSRSSLTNTIRMSA